jgi:FAD:protein FMN transferase
MSANDPIQRRGPSRREFLTLGIGAFLVASVPWSLRMRREAAVRRTIPVMGTLAEVVVVHPDTRHAQVAIDAAFDELRRVEATMSRFRSDSDIGRANHGAATGPIGVSAATAAVLIEALRWADASDGRFDPALGRAVALWDVGTRHAPPAAGEVRRLAGRTLYRELEVGQRGGQPFVRFHDPEVAVDLGGIAKGYAVDRAVETLRARGIRHALVNAGGDLYALGRSPEGDPWQVGVQSPSVPNALAATLLLEDQAVATSCDYRQHFDHGGRRYHHLLDPQTGEPRRTPLHSLTVAAASCMAADAATTALYGCPAPDAARILATVAPGAQVIHQI